MSEPLWWNVGFLVSGALLVLVGALLVRSGRKLLARRNPSPDPAHRPGHDRAPT